MREIKFREWDTKYKKMNYNPLTDCDYINNYFNINDTISIFMQYTGLKDKNEKEIYEGDIVEYDNGEEIFQMLVEWDIASFEFSIINHPYKHGYLLDMSIADEVLIIGNIYENPDLLEKLK